MEFLNTKLKEELAAKAMAEIIYLHRLDIANFGNFEKKWLAAKKRHIRLVKMNGEDNPFCEYCGKFTTIDCICYFNDRHLSELDSLDDFMELNRFDPSHRFLNEDEALDYLRTKDTEQEAGEQE